MNDLRKCGLCATTRFAPRSAIWGLSFAPSTIWPKFSTPEIRNHEECSCGTDAVVADDGLWPGQHLHGCRFDKDAAGQRPGDALYRGRTARNLRCRGEARRAGVDAGSERQRSDRATCGGLCVGGHRARRGVRSTGADGDAQGSRRGTPLGGGLRDFGGRPHSPHSATSFAAGSEGSRGTRSPGSNPSDPQAGSRRQIRFLSTSGHGQEECEGAAVRYVPRVLHYLKPYCQLAIAVGALIVLTGAVDLLMPWPLKILVDNVLGKLPLPEWLQAIVGAGIEPKRLLIFAVVTGLVVALIHNGLSVVNSYVQTKLDQRIVLDFRSDLFQHAQRLSLAFHDQRRSGMLIYAINNQGDAVVGLIMIVPTLVQSLITLVGMFWIVFLMDRWLALLSMMVLPLLLYSVRYYATRIQDRLMRVCGMEGES